MSQKITHDQKETAIEALREHGTMQYASKICGVSVRTLYEEMRRSEVFKRRVLEAREEGKRNIADSAIEMIKSYASGKLPKTDRNVLTANIALANAYEPGFRGTTTIQGRIDYDIRVISAVPRPKYGITEPPKKLLGKGKDNPQNIEDVIEGVAVELKDE